ncbi:HET-domain-containing protein [Armillaria borealis]|uniref:HET-domain-containing protein n=1 Tax=Armillaria borealis TaxID=47425 RepID=A0AA39JKG5_9AGAR|nr:HET-domain-containing protein [Armillaria borealis]
MANGLPSIPIILYSPSSGSGPRARTPEQGTDPGGVIDSTPNAALTPNTADVIRSLVCNDCWDSLFVYDSFREIWEGQSILNVRNPAFKSFVYKSTWGRIDTSSQNGCEWCSLLLSSINPEKHYDYSDDRSDFFWTKPLSVRVAFAVPQHTAETLISSHLVGVWINDYELFNYPIYTTPDDSCAKEVLARNRVLQMKSTATWGLARQNISQCINDHPSQICPKPSSNTVLPTRVIDCTNPDRPKLYVTGGGIHASYVALSYVWGEEQPNKTTQHNINAYVDELRVDSLPQTTKDAIWTTHACGQKYLWIDALCIIQDSREDKRREIAQIPRIFADALFTIIAARSSKASKGFLHDCPPPALTVRRLPFFCQGGPARIGMMYVEQDALGKYDDDRDVHDPVHKRAWCLEERLLSTRALVYTSNTLRFHCPLIRVNVGDAVRQIHDLASHRLNINWLPGPGDELFDPDESSIFDYNRSTTSWDNIVRNYTGRTVTHAEDKLIALAGVTERFSARWKKGAYLAGLWSDNLLHDLLWYKKDGEQLPRSAEYRAPSWSWASVDGPVETAKMLPFGALLYKVRGQQVTLASSLLPFGAVTAGHLLISAPLLRAAWRSDGLYASALAASPSGPPEVQHGTESKIYYAWHDTTEEVGPEVWLLPLCWREKAEELPGLILVPAGERTRYRRVGCFRDFPKWTTKEELQNLATQDVFLI